MKNRALVLLTLAAWLLTAALPLLPAVVALPGASVMAQSALPPAVAAKPASQPGNVLSIPMKQLGDPEGYTLKTVKTERRYFFTKPEQWKALPGSAIKVTFQHSPTLLPERSSLNVSVNNRILKTISLEKANATANTVTIPIPPEILKDRNSVAFQVDQHYTYKCEDPFSTELWTTLLPETAVQVKYAPQPAVLDLARFPYPFFDELGYGQTQLGYVAGPNLSDASLTALARVAAGIGRDIAWRPATAKFVDEGSVRSTPQNLVLVGTPEENRAIADLGSALPVPLSGNQFTDPETRAALDPKDGVVQLVQHPSVPSKTILVISGNSPEGVQNAASLLVQHPTSKLMTGAYSIVKKYEAGPQHPYRAWDGFVQKSGASFNDIGLKTMTTRGFTALPIFYDLKIMPDVYKTPQSKAKLHTVYSYASQLDGKQSKLEVRLNGKTLKSITLGNRDGENLASFDLEIPVEDLYTYNQLEYQFFLYPDKFDLCNFVTDVHIWGTVHSSSTLEFPGEIRTPLPDVGLLNDAAFPFTAHPDLSQTQVVLPKTPTEVDLEVLLQTMTRFGRAVSSKSGMLPSVIREGGAVENDKHLVLIGSPQRNALFDKMNGRFKLVLANKTADVTNDYPKLVSVRHSANQGIVEELLSPFNNNRVALLMLGETDTALQSIADLMADDSRFNAIEPGNLMVVSDQDAPQSVQALKQGDAKFIYKRDLQEGFDMPWWGWTILGFLALIGLFSILGFFFRR